MYEISLYEEENKKEWDDFCEKCSNSTFQHTRTFLDYHKKRFVERSLLIRMDNQLVAVFPAASNRGDDEVVISHVGASYGGLISLDSVYGDEISNIYDSIISYYSNIAIKSIMIKMTPSIFHKAIIQDEVYTLWKIGAILNRTDLSACIDLSNRLKVSSLRKRSFKKANKSGVRLDKSFNKLKEFYAILTENLSQKHSAQAVHSIKELIELKERLNGSLSLSTAHDVNGDVVAGVLFFEVNNVMHAQYIASNAIGYELNALDLLFENEINLARDTGKKYFNFGISNENNGLKLNQSLYRFKRQFGAGSVACQFFEIKVKND